MAAPSTSKLLRYVRLGNPQFDLDHPNYYMKCFYCGSTLNVTGSEEEDSSLVQDALECPGDNCAVHWAETRINREGVTIEETVIEKNMFVRLWNELRRMCEANYKVPKWLQEEYEDGGAF